MTQSDRPILDDTYVFEAANNQVERTPYGHLRHALRYKNFFFFWVRRSLVTRYRQTSLGWLWALLQPLLSSLIYILIFSVIIRVPTGAVPYPLFIITDLVFWTYFNRIVMVGAGSVLGNIDLLSRIQFPREFLPLAVWVESLVDFVLGLCIVVPMFALYHYPLNSFAPLLIVIFAIESMLALGAAFLLASMAVLIRDIMQIVPLLMQLLVYLSPVIYPLTNVPESIRPLYLINPLASIFTAFQDVLFYNQLSAPIALAVTGLVSVLAMIGGYVVFKRVEWRFVDLF